jgi:hypothetical protein
MGHRETILAFLQSLAPEGATNGEIRARTGISPHQQVFQITHKLSQAGHLNRQKFGREWLFFYKPHTQVENLTAERVNAPSIKADNPGPNKMTAREFENFARKLFSAKFGTELKEKQLLGVHKKFDFVSLDGSIVGDAKYYTMVRGHRLPPAKFSVVAEHVWLLEKLEAKTKFLVFGNDQRVPEEWLKRHRENVNKVDFYFLNDDGDIIRLM